jgi:RsiW-degrading membrane proteinase PrsW (M82 family)
MLPIPKFNRLRDISLLMFCSLGILGLLARGTYLTITAILYFDPADIPSLASSLLDALAMVFCICLLLPMMIYCIQRLRGQQVPPAVIKPIKFWQGAALVAGWVIVVILGALLATSFSYGWAVAAPFYLLGISLPILIFTWIAIGGLPTGSRRRLWSVFGFGMIGSTVSAVLLEYLVIGAAIGVVGLAAVTSPELQTVIDQIKTQVANAKGGDMQSLLTALAPYITNPLVILSILGFASVLTPLIEEALKPAVIWFLGKRLHSPAEGFFLGALCGAGFAMLEGLLSASGATNMWGFGIAGRGAASLMHITGSAIFGWGIASARLEKRYGRLALSYLLSVSIHGLWNGSAIITVYGALRVMVQANQQLDIPSILFVAGGLGMLILELVLMLFILPLINHQLRRSLVNASSTTILSDIIAPPLSSNPRENNGMDS